MDAYEACAVIDQLTEYPHWRVRAIPDGRSHVIIRTVIMDGTDSSEPPSFLTVIRPAHSERYDCSQWTSDADVAAAVVHSYVTQFEHEVREFTRLPNGGQWPAPLHPHTETGRQAWRERSARYRRGPDATYNTRVQYR